MTLFTNWLDSRVAKYAIPNGSQFPAATQDAALSLVIGIHGSCAHTVR